ncbi:unnamed protein product [Phytophthora fragariaefolia]|uniref:Unnamed protein product n=1 Tax=Phytophthora fragariaefolia TaxID=1490495 RepID=A0A9W6XIJ8_9STRA|nr:unnamed protein product [Phytophthora fragariaefolia]
MGFRSSNPQNGWLHLGPMTSDGYNSGSGLVGADNKIGDLEEAQVCWAMASERSEKLVVYAEDCIDRTNDCKLGMAIAHVSAQTHGIAEYQVRLHATQQLQAQQQQL